MISTTLLVDVLLVLEPFRLVGRCQSFAKTTGLKVLKMELICFSEALTSADEFIYSKKPKLSTSSSSSPT
jgi:hypothetical protein